MYRYLFIVGLKGECEAYLKQVGYLMLLDGTLLGKKLETRVSFQEKKVGDNSLVCCD